MKKLNGVSSTSEIEAMLEGLNPSPQPQVFKKHKLTQWKLATP